MADFDFSPHHLGKIDIHIAFPELEKKIKTGAKNQAITDCARKLLEEVDGAWDPFGLYRWVEIEPPVGNSSTAIVKNNEAQIELELGHSAKFLKDAQYGLVAIYSAGQEIDDLAQRALQNQDMLGSYMIDLIGLLVLEKTGEAISACAEQKAEEHNWGVGPFLSPGSVHGWELEDQIKLCSLLPIETTPLSLDDNGILHPFKSVSCLVGLGKSYDSKKVGSTCSVCSQRDTCLMREEG